MALNITYYHRQENYSKNYSFTLIKSFRDPHFENLSYIVKFNYIGGRSKFSRPKV